MREFKITTLTSRMEQKTRITTRQEELQRHDLNLLWKMHLPLSSKLFAALKKKKKTRTTQGIPSERELLSIDFAILKKRFVWGKIHPQSKAFSFSLLCPFSTIVAEKCDQPWGKVELGGTCGALSNRRTSLKNTTAVSLSTDQDKWSHATRELHFTRF